MRRQKKNSIESETSYSIMDGVEVLALLWIKHNRVSTFLLLFAVSSLSVLFSYHAKLS